MRIEKLELNKIKVTIYPVDLCDMNINIKALKPDSPQLHTFLFKVMEKVKKETGFNPYSGQIVVEASPMGECVELTVTKISDKKPSSIDKKKIKRVRARIKTNNIKNAVYCFGTFDDLCTALIRISEETLKKASAYEIENTYVLGVSDIPLNEHILLKEFINDFEANTLTVKFLDEHAKLIAKGEKLVSMTNGLKKLYK